MAAERYNVCVMDDADVRALQTASEVEVVEWAFDDRRTWNNGKQSWVAGTKHDLAVEAVEALARKRAADALEAAAEESGDNRMKPPRRRIQLDLDLHADDRDAIIEALHSLADEIELRACDDLDTTCGGTRSGYRVVMAVTDPAMTSERYVQALNEYLATYRAARQTKGES